MTVADYFIAQISPDESELISIVGSEQSYASIVQPEAVLLLSTNDILQTVSVRELCGTADAQVPVATDGRLKVEADVTRNICCSGRCTSIEVVTFVVDKGLGVSFSK